MSTMAGAAAPSWIISSLTEYGAAISYAASVRHTEQSFGKRRGAQNDAEKVTRGSVFLGVQGFLRRAVSAA